MNAETDVELLATIHATVAPIVQAALVHGPLPAMSSKAFLTAPDEVRLAVLAIGGTAWVFARETVESWLAEDYCGGKYHRENLLPVVTELDRLRWPPTGDRDLWVKYGTDGPPTDLAVCA